MRTGASTVTTLIRGACHLVLFVALLGFLGSGECFAHTGHCDDDDHGCHPHDDDDHFSSSGPGPQPATEEAFELRTYTLVRAEEEHAHPVRRLLDVEGVSLTRAWGPGTFGTDEFEEFTAQVLFANQGLIGLPPSAGRLDFVDVDFGEEIVVTWLQRAPDAEGRMVFVPEAELVFAFDHFGSLVRIENTTLLRRLE